jgi:hypothetical protein
MVEYTEEVRQRFILEMSRSLDDLRDSVAREVARRYHLG